MLYAIPIILMSVSIVGISIIIIRRIKSVAIIDVETVPGEQESRVKKRILLERMGRGWKSFWEKIGPVFGSWWEKIHTKFYNFTDRIKRMEKGGKKRRKIKKGSDIFVVIPELLSRAKDEIKKKSYREAERLLVEILSHDSKNIEAYRLLGELYFEEKKYAQAKSTYEFILKLSPDNGEAVAALARIAKLDGDFARARDLYLKTIALNDKESYYFTELGIIFTNLGEMELAFNNFLKANALEPNNPRTLDFLLETSIILKKRDIAENLLAKLREVNPENQKLGEFEEKIKGLPVIE